MLTQRPLTPPYTAPRDPELTQYNLPQKNDTLLAELSGRCNTSLQNTLSKTTFQRLAEEVVSKNISSGPTKDTRDLEPRIHFTVSQTAQKLSQQATTTVNGIYFELTKLLPPRLQPFLLNFIGKEASEEDRYTFIINVLPWILKKLRKSPSQNGTRKRGLPRRSQRIAKKQRQKKVGAKRVEKAPATATNRIKKRQQRGK
ncbi:hypothetical protein H112_08715 [Trichophyton rubrum D6]|uniref:Uncharacterized protein n=5 Tax=Trichophyton TaxID=5550 RepID=A0A178EU50_TRIRU|nr:uncharacterized protein TERG_01262 [Trichophyton rubrum CBS 118892]EZF09986.1 hypothetical protein H100_08737 [Trichophyton rubrum MR850]EZF36840.1 hypothetical protein H102_08696 [Trichophyton rubrum CBS 100081]EZF47435.1 hypothetical protein H103_08718 [Trichophyton rubrum CBS 288.86]EZF58093.1 hypothetical protein H104_08670 [Trichophyton rubrum CBS 289.86]EZF68700.1 hypothetical protein H105_08722 [Trichophyton soudanense CBS 452.61]EZF79394.1 hypothetical protein H110_08721 [Trichophy